MIPKNENKKLIQKKQLIFAYQCAIRDLEKGFAPDPFKYCDLDHNLEETLDETINQLKSGEFQPRQAESLDSPKGEFVVRPGVIVNVHDLAVVHYIMAIIVLY